MRKTFFYLLKKFCKFFGFNLEDEQLNVKEENVAEEVCEVSTKKSYDKIFGKKTLFDEIKKINLEITSIKKYSEEKYNEFKNQLDKLTEDCRIYYEEKECQKEFTLKLTVGSPNFAQSLYEKCYNLLEEVKCYKREEYNYDYASNNLQEFKERLEIIYHKLIADNSKINLLEKAYYHLIEILDEICRLDMKESTFKQEELCKNMCECIYLFLKCNARCDHVCDVSEFEEIFIKEKLTFWDIFLENVKDLLSKTQIFKDEKYCKRYKPYLQAILARNDVSYDILLNKDFLKSFVEKEKKIIELHYYYSLENDTDDILIQSSDEKEEISNGIVEISKLQAYLARVFELYKEEKAVSVKLYLFKNLICNFKYDITEYELYKMVYFFKLKTFFTSHLKGVEKDDLMKKVFISQKDAKISLLKKNSNSENVTFYELLSFNQDELFIKLVRETLSKLNIYFEEIQDNTSDKVHRIFFCAEFFEDSINIMKNLNEFEKIQ